MAIQGIYILPGIVAIRPRQAYTPVHCTIGFLLIDSFKKSGAYTSKEGSDRNKYATP